MQKALSSVVGGRVQSLVADENETCLYKEFQTRSLVWIQMITYRHCAKYGDPETKKSQSSRHSSIYSVCHGHSLFGATQNSYSVLLEIASQIAFFGGGSTFFCLGVIIRRTDHQSALPSLANQTVPQHLILEWCAAMAGWELEWSPVAVICPFFLLRSLHSP